MKRNILILSSRCLAPMALGLVLFCPSVAATILFSNTPISESAGNRPLVTSAQYQSFSNGAGSFSLTDVEILLNGSPDTISSLSVDLRADSSTTPGALLDHIGTLPDSSLVPNSNTLFDFPTAAFALSANTRYWIEVSTTNGSDANWDLEAVFAPLPPGDIGVAGEFHDDTGVVSPDDRNIGSTPFREAFQMQVTVSATTSGVPEPSAFLLGGVGLLTLAALHWRR